MGTRHIFLRSVAAWSFIPFRWRVLSRLPREPFGGSLIYTVGNQVTQKSQYGICTRELVKTIFPIYEVLVERQMLAIRPLIGKQSDIKQ